MKNYLVDIGFILVSLVYFMKQDEIAAYVNAIGIVGLYSISFLIKLRLNDYHKDKAVDRPFFKILAFQILMVLPLLATLHEFLISRQNQIKQTLTQSKDTR